MHRAEELVRTTCPSKPAVARREIVAEDVCPRDLMFLEQPADQRCGSSGLRRSERIGFGPRRVRYQLKRYWRPYNDSRNQRH